MPTPNTWSKAGKESSGLGAAAVSAAGTVAAGFMGRRAAERAHEMRMTEASHRGDVAVSVAERLSKVGGKLESFEHEGTSAKWLHDNDNENTGQPSAHTVGTARHPHPQFLGMPSVAEHIPELEDVQRAVRGRRIKHEEADALHPNWREEK